MWNKSTEEKNRTDTKTKTKQKKKKKKEARKGPRQINKHRNKQMVMSMRKESGEITSDREEILKI